MEPANREWQSMADELSFAADGKGIVRWGRPNGSMEDIPDFEEAVKAVDGKH